MVLVMAPRFRHGWSFLVVFAIICPFSGFSFLCCFVVLLFCCLLLVVCCLFFVVCCLLLVVCCLLFVVLWTVLFSLSIFSLHFSFLFLFSLSLFFVSFYPPSSLLPPFLFSLFSFFLEGDLGPKTCHWAHKGYLSSLSLLEMSKSDFTAYFHPRTQ